MMRRSIVIRFFFLILLLFVTGVAGAAEKPVFQRQTIHLGVDLSFSFNRHYQWTDFNSDGRMDLIAMTTSGTLMVYRQEQAGFPSSPTQSWPLPPKTAWVKVMDVLPDPGMEIVYSVPDGIYCYRQNKTGFDLQPVLLIQASQVQLKGQGEVLLVQNEDKKGKADITTKTLNTVFADHYDQYMVDDKYHISLVKRVDMENEGIIWSASSKSGMEESGLLNVTIHSYRNLKKDQANEKTQYELFEKERIAKLDKEKLWTWGVEEEDVNGDGAKDWTLWFMPREMDSRTIFEIYLRQKDGKLPEKPTLVQRYRGGPVQMEEFYLGMDYYPASPFIDVNRDGLPDIFLLEIRNKAISVSSFLEMAVKNGLDLTCAVILGRKSEAFPLKPDFRLDITAALPWSRKVSSIVSLRVDFNKDGRPDLLVRRNGTQLDVYLSSRTGDLFERQPAFSFEIPEEASPIVEDYNKDGISDLCLEDSVKREIVLFLSQKQN